MASALNNPARRTELAGGVMAAATLAVGSGLVRALEPVGKAGKGDGQHGAFDVIILGGGSAGPVLARRLSENTARRVLLEAGHTR